jgi:hypothetical protein
MPGWIDEARKAAAWADSQPDQDTFIRSDVYHGSEIRRLWKDMPTGPEDIFLTLSMWWGMCTWWLT